MTNMTASTAEMVRWERPGDENLTWFWDDYLCPAPVATLTRVDGTAGVVHLHP